MKRRKHETLNAKYQVIYRLALLRLIKTTQYFFYYSRLLLFFTFVEMFQVHEASIVSRIILVIGLVSLFSKVIHSEIVVSCYFCKTNRIKVLPCIQNTSLLEQGLFLWTV